MVTNEIKETVYIGVSLMILSLVLGMIAYVIDIRADFADVRNSEISTSKRMSEYRKFNKYDSKEIAGVDIVELIREMKDENIEIYVDKRNGGSSYHITPQMIKLNPNTIEVNKLQNEFSPNIKYISYLVYDFEDVTTVTNPATNSSYSTVTGIAIIYNP